MTATKTSRFRRALAFALVVALAPTSVLAQVPKPDPFGTAEAKTHFDKGLKLYKEGALREALAEFLQANRLQPRASVLRNIAQCHRDLRQFAVAYGDYTEMLKLYGQMMKPAETKQVKSALADLAVLTGQVVIKVTEPDAHVEIDQKDVGATPLGPQRVNVGTHQVVVTKPGFETLTKQVEIQGNDEAVVAGEFRAETSTAHLTVTAPGADATARLRIDDHEVGHLPWSGDLSPGLHRLDVTGKDLRAPSRSVDLVRGSRLEVTLELTKQVGHLLVDPHVAEAEIRLDGERVGKGVWEGDVKTGKHEIVISAPGYAPYTRAVLLHDGERRVESIGLESLGPNRVQEYRGVYAQLDGSLLVSPNPNNYVEAICTQTNACDTGGLAIGPAGTIAIGYNPTGWLGLEGVGYFRIDFAREIAGPSNEVNTTITQIAFGGGAGVRAISKNPTSRATAGVRFLVLHEAFSESANDKPGAIQVSTRHNVGANVPALAFDIGLLLGNTPGTKFKVGAVAQMEFFGSEVDEPNATVTGAGVQNVFVEKGMEFFIGPTLGFEFGY